MSDEIESAEPRARRVRYALADQLRPEHTALVLVDVQNDFVHPAGWVARQQMPRYLDSTSVPEAVAAIAELLSAAREADVLRIFVRMLGDLRYLSPAMLAQYRRLQGPGRPQSTLEGSWGADFHESVLPDGSDREITVDKYRYSAFAGTRLDLILRSHRIETLVLCGVATSGCVESTTRDGLFHDYYVVTASDCCADYDRDRHESSLRKMDVSFGYVVPMAEVVGCWRTRS
jgi:nicotinamidase-related amidase